MNTNNEINVIRNILTESANKQQELNEVSLKALSWAIPAIAGGLYTGSQSVGAEYEKFKNKGTLQNAWDSIVNPTETASNLGDSIKNITLDTAKGVGYGLGTRAAVTPLGRAAIRGTANVVEKGAMKAVEALPGAAREAGKAAGIAGETAKAVGQELGKGIKVATPVVKQGVKKATELTGQAVSKASEVVGQVVKQAGSAISNTGQAVKGVSNIRLTPGSLARGLAGGVGGLVAGAVTSPIVRKGLEAVGVENEDVKDVADTIISGGVGSGVGALIAGGSVAGAAAAGAAVPAAAIAGWQAGRQIGNRIGAGDASKTGAYEQTKEKGWWDLAKGVVGMDDESIRQREIEAEGKKAEERQKEFFANQQKKQEIKNTFNIGGIQTGLQDFYTKPR
jgi:hypothetical protein